MSEHEATKLVDQVLARHGETVQDKFEHGKAALRESRVAKALQTKKTKEQKKCVVSIR